MKNFIKHTGHLYTAFTQNGFNNALYEYFDCDGGGSYSKKDVRRMVQNFPKSYPQSFVIIDHSFECCRVHIECVDIKKAATKIRSWSFYFFLKRKGKI